MAQGISALARFNAEVAGADASKGNNSPFRFGRGDERLVMRALRNPERKDGIGQVSVSGNRDWATRVLGRPCLS